MIILGIRVQKVLKRDFMRFFFLAVSNFETSPKETILLLLERNILSDIRYNNFFQENKLSFSYVSSAKYRIVSHYIKIYIFTFQYVKQYFQQKIK